MDVFKSLKEWQGGASLEPEVERFTVYDWNEPSVTLFQVFVVVPEQGMGHQHIVVSEWDRRGDCMQKIVLFLERADKTNKQETDEHEANIQSEPAGTSERSPFLRCARAMLSSQVRLSSGVLA